MKSTKTTRPVLILGGSGVVGGYVADELRRLYPDLRLVLGGRDLEKARAAAARIGEADGVKIDLARDDLGLPAGAEYGAVIALLKDDTLNSLRLAQERRIPYLAISDFAFDIGPTVALFAAKPPAAPILLLGHSLGGVTVMSALHFAREFRRVDKIAATVVVDKEDSGGPAAVADMERTAFVPRPLIFEAGRWVWAREEEATRRVRDVDGRAHEARAYALLDVVSLVAATDAEFARLEFAVRDVKAGTVKILVEIEGLATDGSVRQSRHSIVDRASHNRMTALGVVFATERLLGLADEPPVPSGLYHPENILAPERVVRDLKARDIRVD